MEFDFSRLKGLMREKHYTQDMLADEICVSRTVLNLKLNNKSDFKLSEVVGICKVLGITNPDAYFFTPKLQRFEA